MLLFVFTMTIAFAGIVAMEFGQAPRPREFAVWNDDIERRLLRLETGRPNRW